MPIYEFDCGACGNRFDELVKTGETPACPSCGSNDVERRISGQFAYVHFGLRGRDARRSEAKRKDRREREAERKRRAQNQG